MHAVAPSLYGALRSLSRATPEERAAILARLPEEQRAFARLAFEVMCSIPRLRGR